jgi:hypothetical protein
MKYLLKARGKAAKALCPDYQVIIKVFARPWSSTQLSITHFFERFTRSE